MGYMIQYEPEKNKKYPMRKNADRNVSASVLVALILVVCLGIGLRTGLLLPGDPQVTANAFSQLVTNLTEGESIHDAMSAFCVEVLEHANAD